MRNLTDVSLTGCPKRAQKKEQAACIKPGGGRQHTLEIGSNASRDKGAPHGWCRGLRASREAKKNAPSKQVLSLCCSGGVLGKKNGETSTALVW